MVSDIRKIKLVIKNIIETIPLIENAEEGGNPNKFYGLNTLCIIEKLETSEFLKTINRFPVIKNTWNNFKASINEYDSERQIVFNTIKGHLERILKDNGFDTEQEIKEGFYLSIYRESIIRVKGEISLYDYYEDPTQKQAPINVFWYRKDYCKKAEGGGFFLETCHNLSETQTQERREVIESIHDEMIKICKKDFFIEINRLIKKENIAKRTKENMDDMLDKITDFKLFCQMLFGSGKLKNVS